MARFQHYHCSACGKVFRFCHVLSDEPPPAACQLCGAVMEDDAEPVFVPQAPGIRKSLLVESEQKLYRRMEAASIQRAEEAASVAGVPTAAMSHLKLTNMREIGDMREGDTAAIMPATKTEAIPITAPTEAGGQGGYNPLFNQQGQAMTGDMFAQAVPIGDAPRAGEQTRVQAILPKHNDRAWRMTVAGQMNTHPGTR